ncbi:hypothetical protein D3C81_737460 [compost metagenome]
MLFNNLYLHLFRTILNKSTSGCVFVRTYEKRILDYFCLPLSCYGCVWAIRFNSGKSYR